MKINLFHNLSLDKYLYFDLLPLQIYIKPAWTMQNLTSINCPVCGLFTSFPFRQLVNKMCRASYQVIDIISFVILFPAHLHSEYLMFLFITEI